MAPVALAFAVLHLTGSATALGIVLAARMVPNVFLLAVGGVIADRTFVHASIPWTRSPDTRGTRHRGILYRSVM